ncbi:MAG: serine protease [Actinomycetes bacterium]
MRLPRPFLRPRVRRVAGAGVVAVLLVAAVAGGPAGVASAEPRWAAAGTAAVHPGVATHTAGGQCTSNFVFTRGSAVLLGQAAHCAGTGGATETDGCDSHSRPLGTRVRIEGAQHRGTLVYSSWRAMQASGESNANTCAYNDLALVRVHRADRGKVNPSVPFWGGPTGVARGGTATGDAVFSYGNSSLRLGLAPLSPKTGTSLGDTGGGWSHDVLTASPGVPGDSGSAFLAANGKALGTLSTLALAPLPGSNGVGNLAKEMAYARSHGMSGLKLVRGTQPFTRLLP